MWLKILIYIGLGWIGFKFLEVWWNFNKWILLGMIGSLFLILYYGAR